MSESSWAKQQKMRSEDKGRAEEGEVNDKEVLRKMKSILNKLTVEKFEPLYEQLVNCGISTPKHVELMIAEVFEKATTQHHFIQMYAQLCVRLNEWFEHSGIVEDRKNSFKHILLHKCWEAFNVYLKPPPILETLIGEAFTEAQIKCKNAMLGNIRFIGSLLEMKMLASSALFDVAEELVAGQNEQLECLAAFLTAVGHSFDKPEWADHPRFEKVFEKLQERTQDKSIPARIRYLLTDVLDLRASNWEDTKKATQRNEGPMKLGELQSKVGELQSKVAYEEDLQTAGRKPANQSNPGRKFAKQHQKDVEEKERQQREEDRCRQRKAKKNEGGSWHSACGRHAFSGREKGCLCPGSEAKTAQKGGV